MDTVCDLGWIAATAQTLHSEADQVRSLAMSRYRRRFKTAHMRENAAAGSGPWFGAEERARAVKLAAV